MAREEAAKAAEKAEKDRLAVELETKKNEIAKLAQELDDQKRKREEEISEANKRKKIDFVAQCATELKCAICEEVFIDVSS